VAHAIQQNRWHLLGGALRDLRVARDIGQKAITVLSGEAMGERLLRAYESGEKRPSRDRLLKLLVNSFELQSAIEIDRFLQLAGYAVLTETEIARRGIQNRVPQNGIPAVSPLGPPADFHTEVCTLIVVDGQGRELWRHQFPTRLLAGGYQDREGIRRCTFADIDGDGMIETLFVHAPIDFGSEGMTLICFAQDGTIKWQFTPGKAVRDSTPREYFPPYFISNVAIIPMKESTPRILVSSNHYLHNPNQIAMLDATGKVISEYWHSGHLLSVAHADLDGDGHEEVLLAGVNNGYRQGTVVIFDSRRVTGVSRQPDRQILGMEPGTERAVILLPRTCVSKNALYTRVSELRITRERRIVVVVAEGVSDARNPGGMIYEFDFGLNVVNARPDSHLQEAHRELEAAGELDHPWTEKENQRLRSQVVVMRQPQESPV
jgi:hypothetical protein